MIPAHAAAQAWALDGVTFTDSTTATGVFTINQYGFPEAPVSITTISGTISGYSYTFADPLSINNPADTIFEASRSTPASYDGYLHLEFANPLSVAAATDPLVLGGASYECDSFASYPGGMETCGGTSRLIIAGDAVLATAVPEPTSLAVLGVGVAGLALTRRRKPA